jgi:hypothetical protein
MITGTNCTSFLQFFVKLYETVHSELRGYQRRIVSSILAQKLSKLPPNPQARLL